MSEGVVNENAISQKLPDFRSLQLVDLSVQEAKIKETFNQNLQKFIREEKSFPHPASLQNGKQFGKYVSVVASIIARTNYILGFQDDVDIKFFGDSNNMARGGGMTIEFNIDDIYKSCTQLKEDKSEAKKEIRKSIAEENFHNWQSVNEPEKYKKTQVVARNLAEHPNDPEALIAYLSDPGEVEAKQFGIAYGDYEESIEV